MLAASAGYIYPVGHPYLMFALGWGSALAWARGWMSYLAPALAERGLLPPDPVEGVDYDLFDWGRPSCFVASVVRTTEAAAGDLAARLPERDDVTLVGHSKAGNLVLEYLAQVAEGRLPPHAGLRRAVVLNAPIDNPAARAALAHLDPSRLVDLERRLAGRGVMARVQIVHDPTDPISRPLALPGLDCLVHTSGRPGAVPRLPFGYDSLQVWNRNHMACFRDGWTALLDALESSAPEGALSVRPDVGRLGPNGRGRVPTKWGG
jgi:hypothetical protein